MNNYSEKKKELVKSCVCVFVCCLIAQKPGGIFLFKKILHVTNF